MRIVVLGEEGLGRQVVEKLNWAGLEAAGPIDLRSAGALGFRGLLRDLEGATVVVDVTEGFLDADLADFSGSRLQTLLDVEEAAGVTHHLSLSIVGADRPDAPDCLERAMACERIVRGHRIPYTIVRSTQTFETLGGIADASTLAGTARLSSAAMQPIALADVAEALAEYATASPANGSVEIAGPERAPLAEFVGTWLGALDDPRMIVVAPDAPFYGSPIGENALLPGPGAAVLPIHFEDWLEVVLEAASA